METINPGDVISHTTITLIENAKLQRGMNFRLKGGLSVFLMSVRKNAPYADKVEENGQILIYEGHDVAKNIAKNPKSVDQPMQNPTGSLTENGKFYESVRQFKKKQQYAERVKVYEKLKKGIWVYNGIFELIDAWIENSEGRKVFKFKLQVTDESFEVLQHKILMETDMVHNRMIAPQVKLEVWQRDKGKCVKCGSTNNLHFDHILPFSKGGGSLTAQNIQLLCARHNLEKSDKIAY